MSASMFFSSLPFAHIYICANENMQRLLHLFLPLLQDVLPVILTFYRKRQKDRTQRCGLDFFRIYAVNGKM